MKHINLIRTSIAGLALAALSAHASMAWATCIAWTSWSAHNLTCSSGSEQAYGYVDNSGSALGNRYLLTRFLAGVNKSRTLAIDSSGNAISGCEAIDTDNTDGVGVIDYCTTANVPAGMYLWVQ
jgi:hypothetical protein